jgi:AcrR family transcriptional regulator
MTEQVQRAEAGSAGHLPTQGMPDWQLARRRRIVDAALRVLSEGDYARIQITDVLAEAKVARGTMYRYFASKDHLYAVVLSEWAGMEGSDQDGGYAGRPAAGTAEAEVRARVRGIVRAFERKPQFFKAFVDLQDSPDSDAVTTMADLNKSATRDLARYFAALGDDRAEDTASMLWSMIGNLLIRAIYHDGTMRDVYRLADRFVDLATQNLRG